MMTSNAVDSVDIRTVYEFLTKNSTANARNATRRDIFVLCPFHDDENPSMTLNLVTRTWYCHYCKIGGGIADLICMLRPSDFQLPLGDPRTQRRAAFDWLRDHRLAADDSWRIGLRALPNRQTHSKSGFRQLTDTKWLFFDYRDENDDLRYQAIRIEGKDAEGNEAKDFKQRTKLPEPGAWVEDAAADRWVYHTADGTAAARVTLHKPDGKRRRKPAGPWVWELSPNQQRLLYHLSDVRRAAAAGETIYIVEGEKKCDALRARSGLCVTTWNGGASADLEPAWLRWVAGAKRIVVLADSDGYKLDRKSGEMRSKGRDAALERAEFFRRVCFSTYALDLYPDGVDGEDVYDWLLARPIATAADITAELETLIAHATPIER